MGSTRQQLQKPNCPTDNQYLSPQELADSEICRFSTGTLANWRSQGKGPRYYKVGRKVLYHVADVLDFIRSNPVLTIDSLPADQRGKEVDR